DQFHPHLMHKANVVGTAIGRYLIRKGDPDPSATATVTERGERTAKPPRTLANSEVRPHSWPCILVFVSRWAKQQDFGPQSEYGLVDYIPKRIYLEDGRVVPICGGSRSGRRGVRACTSGQAGSSQTERRYPDRDSRAAWRPLVACLR